MLRSLRRKIIASHLVLVIILIGAGAWGVVNFIRLNGVIQSVTEENYRSVIAAENMVAALERQDSAELLFLLGETGRAQEIFQTGQTDFTIWFGRAEDNITIREEIGIIASIRKEYQDYLKLWELLQSEPLDHAKALYKDEAQHHFLLVRGLCAELLRVNHEALVQGNYQAATASQIAVWSTVAVTGAAAVFALGLATSLSDRIVRPTERLTESVRRIGEGAPREVLPVTSGDEIGELTAEFNRMNERLRAFEESNLGQLLTERRKSEVILKSMIDPVFVMDRDMRIVMVNRAAEQAFGVREEAMLGRHFLEATGRSDIVSLIHLAREPGARESGAQQPSIGLKVGGEEHFYSVEAAPLTGVGGTLVGSVVILKDVTYYKQIDRLKSEFVSTASHEFRTPLTAITMGAGLLRESPAIKPGSREAELLTVISEESDRLARLVNELLDLSRMEAGKMEFVLEPISAAALLERSVQPFQVQAGEKGIRLEVRLTGTEPAVTADGDKITWVLTNLVSNALRYTLTGGSVTLTAQKRGECVLFQVADTGIGIPQDAQKRLFERFFQVPGRPGGGAGLGLAISKEIVRAHGGHIWVNSQEGQGSCFQFTLPLARRSP